MKHVEDYSSCKQSILQGGATCHVCVPTLAYAIEVRSTYVALTLSCVLIGVDPVKNMALASPGEMPTTNSSRSREDEILARRAMYLPLTPQPMPTYTNGNLAHPFFPSTATSLGSTSTLTSSHKLAPTSLFGHQYPTALPTTCSSLPSQQPPQLQYPHLATRTPGRPVALTQVHYTYASHSTPQSSTPRHVPHARGAALTPTLVDKGAPGSTYDSLLVTALQQEVEELQQQLCIQAEYERAARAQVLQLCTQRQTGQHTQRLCLQESQQQHGSMATPAAVALQLVATVQQEKQV